YSICRCAAAYRGADGFRHSRRHDENRHHGSTLRHRRGEGFFKSEGLNGVVVVMQNQVVVNGVVTRNIDYGGTFSNFIGAALSGLPVRIVMAVIEGCDHYLVTAPKIKRVEDLKGKKF